MAWVPFAAMAASHVMDKMSSNDKMNKVATMTSGQKKILGDLQNMIGRQGGVGQGMSGAVDYQRQLMDPSSQAVNQFAQPYMNQFNQQTVPGLAERFAGAGAMGGGLSSSGFGQALGAAGGNLQAQLAQLKAGLGQQAAQSLMSQYNQMSGQGLNAQPFGYQQQGPSAAGGMMQGWAQGGFGGLQNFQGIGGGGGGGGGGWASGGSSGQPFNTSTANAGYNMANSYMPK